MLVLGRPRRPDGEDEEEGAEQPELLARGNQGSSGSCSCFPFLHECVFSAIPIKVLALNADGIARPRPATGRW